jgi:hypothetical protein
VDKTQTTVCSRARTTPASHAEDRSIKARPRLSQIVRRTVVAAAAFSLLFGWWFRPFAHLAIHGGQSRIQPNIFDVQGIVPIGYTLFAFALGTTAGTLIRRTVPAMAVTIAGFLVTRLAIQVLRGHHSDRCNHWSVPPET